MNIRLVAYRPATSSVTVDTTYELDLQEAPNVSLNFQFSDIKEPETRKASYSQTFKLPFTDANNEFFQNWFNVNLTTLVFSTRTKFNATLYVGTIPQFEGFIQLKAVYQKAEYYEVVLMSNTADLFSAIGEKRLKDIFLESNGSYSNELNHLYTNTNIKASWNGGSADFENTSGVSLRDGDAGVQKVMYPITATEPKFFYDDTELRYLNLTAAEVSAIGNAAASQYIVPIIQLRPAIQLKELFKLIIARAGFSYTSTFIDDDPQYFGKLFMTTGNKLEEPALPIANTSSVVPGGSLDASNSSDVIGAWYNTYCTSNCTYDCGVTPSSKLFKAEVENNDSSNCWNNTYHVFKKVSPTMTEVTICGRSKRRNIKTCPVETGVVDYDLPITVKAMEWDSDTLAETGNILTDATFTLTDEVPGASTGYGYEYWTCTIDISSMSVDAEFRLRFFPDAFIQQITGTSNALYLALGGISGGCGYGRITCNWVDYSLTQYGLEIDVPACIDEEITQKAFLKDIIERFNLVILSDPDNASNVIIETYNDYIGSGTLKHWTDKLDISKEVVVKDTTSLQKRIINLTDLEDVDVMNKSIKEATPSLNVYGHYYNDKTENDFATGELKNSPIFSPYINQQVFKSTDTQTGTDLANMAIHYEISYNSLDATSEEPTLEPTKPKLFYYNGTVTTVLDSVGNTKTYNMHDITVGVITVFDFTSYPVCTTWDIVPSSNEYTLTPANRSLYWNFAQPFAPNLTVFNFIAPASGYWQKNTLFFLYWEAYLNNIYSSDARIMECHLNLNEVDIFDFKFSDEIFIKDSYWRIINISNYQVGDNVSTKVTLLKLLDSLYNAEGCDSIAVGSSGNYLTWCDNTSPGCTPDVTAPDYAGLYASPACCEAAGGLVDWGATTLSSSGLYKCFANGGSLPAKFKSQNSPLAITNTSQLKTIITGKLGGTTQPFVVGVNTGKFAQKILPYFGDDIVIKYETKIKAQPQLQGESHRIVLSGYTEGNTRGYAYPEGNSYGRKIIIPNNCNLMVQVKGISTVIGGTSSTYTVGVTESFSYHTGFINSAGVVEQIGTAGGVVEWSLKDPALSTTSTLYIVNSSSGELTFGLDDSQTDTKKIWALTVDLAVQKIDNLSMPYGENWALWQNADYIELMNFNFLIWN
jgi:hypothetical protein